MTVGVKYNNTRVKTWRTAHRPVNADDVNEETDIFGISQTLPEVYLRYLHIYFSDFANHVSQFPKTVFVRFC